jgi:leader peptidase (prepilin peptidase)/N-methyltransferase
MFDVFQQHPLLFLCTVALLGLVVGSFLNVVIHRVPIMMKNAWEDECREWLNTDSGAATGPASAAARTSYNLVVPRSQCPACGRGITPVENIPIISYLMLRGRCAGCGTPISVRYPAIEAITAILSLAAAWHFGFGWETAAALIFTWALIALAGIDFETRLLPDSITVSLLWLGLLVNMGEIFTDLQSSVLGAVFGYLSLWGVYHLFKLLTGKEGMGYGDFKLLAALGAWGGWQLLPLIVLLASVVGAVVGLALIVIKGRDQNVPIPFGPYLAVAGWIALLWGADVNHWYLRQVL